MQPAFLGGGGGEEGRKGGGGELLEKVSWGQAATERITKAGRGR